MDPTRQRARQRELRRLAWEAAYRIAEATGQPVQTPAIVGLKAQKRAAQRAKQAARLVKAKGGASSSSSSGFRPAPPTVPPPKGPPPLLARAPLLPSASLGPPLQSASLRPCQPKVPPSKPRPVGRGVVPALPPPPPPRPPPPPPLPPPPPPQAVLVMSHGQGTHVTSHLEVDVRHLTDPAAWQIRTHDGRHPEIQLRLIRLHGAELSHIVSQVFEVVQSTPRSTEVRVSFGCRSGRHRSVAVAELVVAHLSGLGYDARTAHQNLSSRPCNSRCAACQSPPTEAVLREMHMALDDDEDE